MMWYFLYCLFTLISAEIITLIKDNNIICVVTEKSAPLQPHIARDGEVTDYRKKNLKQIDHEWSNDDWIYSDLQESYFGPVLDSRWENFPSLNCISNFISTKNVPVSFSICISKDLNFTLKNFKGQSENCRLHQNQQSSTETCVWHHYTINKTDTHIQFISKREIENCSLSRKVYLPECLIWKIHDYEFRSSSVITENEESSLSVTSSDNLCLSLYVSVDEDCFLNITLKTDTANSTKTVEGFNKKNELRSWQSIEIKIDSNGTGTLSFFRGQNDKNSKTGFWAIDDIKFCRSIETYSTSLAKNYSNKQLCAPLKKHNSTNEIPHCPSGYLGKYCNISCNQVLEESNSTCQKYKICNGDKCTCAWGFRGTNCDQHCPKNYWGLNCTSKCDPWCKTCNPQDGCLAALPFLLEAPVLKSLTNSSVTISVENSTYNKNTITMTPQFFQIQYKKDGETVFQNYLTQRNFSRILEDITIQGISINKSDYNVRILLKVENSSFEEVPELKIYKRSLRGTLYSSYNESCMKLTWNGIHEDNSTIVTYYLQYECNNKFCSADNISNIIETTNTSVEISNLQNSRSCKIRLFSVQNVRRLIDEIVLDHNDTDINDNELPRNVTFVDKYFRMELPECENFKGALVYHLKWLNESQTINLTKYDNKSNIFVGIMANSSRINLTVTANRLDKTKKKDFVVEIPKLVKTTVPSREFMRFPTTTTKPEALEFQTKKGGTEIIIVVAVSIVVTLCLICLLFLYWFRKFPFKNETKEVKLDEIQPLVEYSNEDVKINKFEDYLLTATGEDNENNELTKQYQRIPMNFDTEKVHGSMPENTKKNRYKNIVPYDSTRVALKDNDGDYINANYIDGYEAPRTFIATQAPLPTTINDFWTMVWQEKASAIVMLTELVENGKVKCEKYWPEDQSEFGKFFIENKSTLEYPDYVHRKLLVKFDNETHLVEHLQYVTWPDHGVPNNLQDFTTFMKKFVDLPRNAPIVVHCNAGCGRTGTVILCDIALRMAAKEDKINFSKILAKMRQQRPNQVNCVEQYIFAHFVVLECMLVHNFSIPIDDCFQTGLQKALKDSSIKIFMANIHRVTERYEKKNFWSKSSIADDEKILLSDLQSLMSKNNAVIVDGYRFPNRFVVAQQPLPNTVSEFWKMVQHFDISLIVSLNEIEESDPKCPKFWPRYDSLSVNDKVLPFYSETFYKSHNEIKVNYNNNEKDVVILDVKNWKRETLTPENTEDLICLWKEIRDHKNKILVTCYDGITASGLFVALSFLIEKMDKENVCDVFSAVRTVKNNRVEFVRDPVQVKFLYSAAQIYYVQEFLK